MIVDVSQCAHCPSPRGQNIVGGETLCDACAFALLPAATGDLRGTPQLLHELPSAGKAKRGSSGRQRDGRRLRAERAAVAKLKLMHLTTFNALYADELHRHGLQPAAGVSFDVHLRKLAGSRLAALTRRIHDA